MKNKIMFNLIIIFLIINMAVFFITINQENISVASSEVENSDTSVFDKNIKKYNWTVGQDSSGTSYGLLSPPGIERIKNVPLIVWLHGIPHYGMQENTPDDASHNK